ncbi:MAG: glycosyltransferase [Prevotellaceae bacterium]|jgi:glycosyltransferase involved in cell wall biosynthesis|nr:glycosyltransferase [Prevotellaceae bacterium]
MLSSSFNISPQISVVIPVYNTAETLLYRALNSVLNQTFIDFELILVNDCSTNAVPEILNNYAEKDNRIKIIHNQQRIDCPQSREAGLKQAKGSYILFADSDDWLKADMLEELYNTAVNNDLDIAYCDYYMTRNGNIEHIRQGGFVDKIDFCKRIFSHTTWGVVWNRLVKKTLYENIVFPVDFMHEDEVIMFQLLYFAQRVGYVEKPLYYYTFRSCFIYNFNRNKAFSGEEINLINGAYNNYSFIINFCKKNNSNLNIFEPQISDRLNEIKIWFAFKNRKMCFDLYPQSHRRIFNKSLNISELNKFRFFCKIYRLPFLPFWLWVKMKKIFKFLRLQLL